LNLSRDILVSKFAASNTTCYRYSAEREKVRGVRDEIAELTAAFGLAAGPIADLAAANTRVAAVEAAAEVAVAAARAEADARVSRSEAEAERAVRQAERNVAAAARASVAAAGVDEAAARRGCTSCESS
jgi:hypothetical protein